MYLKDYLNENIQARRYLIVAKQARGTACLKQYERETNQPVRNVVLTSLLQLAKEIFAMQQSKEESEITILNKEEALLFFRDLLLEKASSLRYFHDENMLNLTTTKEIFNKVNFLRANGYKQELENDRWQDLKEIIMCYEKELDEKHCFDTISLLRYAIEHSECLNSYAYAYFKEEKEYFSGLELSLLESFSKVEELELFPKDLTIKDIHIDKDIVNFYKGYGTFNEALYIAYDILKKKIPFGDITVLYTSSRQIASLSAALNGNGLPTCFISGKPLYDNPYVSLIRRIFEWAKAGYGEKELARIVESSILYVKDEEENNLLASKQYYDHVLKVANRFEDAKVLGWGFERNYFFVESEIKRLTESGKTDLLPIYQMHHDLLGIFASTEDETKAYEEIIPQVLFSKLLAFLKQYTILDTTGAFPLLEGIERSLRFDTRCIPLEEAMDFILELIENLKQNEKESGNAIKCESLNDWTILDRPNVYVIGLSLKDLQVNTTQSPVLKDEEMLALSVKGYVPTIQKQAAKKDMGLLYTLHTFQGEMLTFGYSAFDSMAFFTSNPSFFYREVFQQFASKPFDKIPEFVVGNPKENVFYPGFEKEEKEMETFKLPTSSSSVEVFVDCPRRYAYDRIYHLPSDEYREFDSQHWLNAAERGTFVHAIMERYMKEEMIGLNKFPYAKEVNAALVHSIAQEIKEEMLEGVPVAFVDLAESETEDLTSIALLYLMNLHQSLQIDGEEAGWRILSCEQDFSNATFTISSYQNKNYEFTFRGSIDRIDYYLDEEKEEVSLRIVDYKTGMKKNKEKADEKGALLQYTLYKTALMETGKTRKQDGTLENLLDVLKDKIATLEHNEKVKDWDYIFTIFRYEFPADLTADSPIDIPLTEQTNPLNLIRLRYVLSLMEEKNTYPDVFTLEKNVEVYEKQQQEVRRLEDAFSEDACRFCPYEDLCIAKKAGEKA